MNNQIYYHVFLVLALYTGLFISFYGWGRIAFKILKFDLNSIRSPFFPLVWTGWATALLIMQFIQLFLPLDWRVSTSVYLLGGVYSVAINIQRIHLFKINLKLFDIKLLILFFFILVITVWTGFVGMKPAKAYDSGLYHFNTIRWINSYPIIPGLGNLHGRLAYNQSYFVYAASLNFFPYFPYTRSIANSFLFLLVVTEIMWQLYSLTRKRDPSVFIDTVSYIPYLFGLLFVIQLGLTSNVDMTSPTVDFPSSLIQLVLFFWFIQIFTDIQNKKEPNDLIFIVFILAITAVTIKLSNFVFAMTLLTICLLYSLKFIKQRIFTGKFTRSILLSLVILFVWVIRGIYLSGYPVYPIAIGKLSVDWAIPTNAVQSEADWIYSWARMPGHYPNEVIGNWNWFHPWLNALYKYYKITVIYPTLLAIGLGLLAVVLAFFQKKLRLLYEDFILFIPSLAGILFWFFTAPDPRFANALFFLLLLTAILVFTPLFYDLIGALPGIVVIESIFVIAIFLLFQARYPNIKSDFTVQYKPIQTVSLVEKKTDSGLIVYSPAEGDQCWDSPLPCTPNLNSKLKLRIPGRIESGFTVK